MVMSTRSIMTGALVAAVNLIAVATGQAQTEVVVTPQNLSLRTASGVVAGEVHSILLDPDLGSVRLVVIDLAGPSPRTVAIPWSSLAVRRDGTFWLAIPEDELLRAPAYPLVAARVTTDGVVIPRERVHTVISGTTYSPSDAGVARFDASRVVSYRGTVVGTMTAPLQGGLDVVEGVIDAGAEEIHADLGAQFYLEQIGCDIEPGQSVVVEGSRSDEDVLVVSKITLRDRTFVLRNSDGSPRWR
jgi:hypothetical protein